MKRLAVALLALATASALGLAWSQRGPAGHGTFPSTDDVTYHGDGPQVVVLGDSITNLAHDRIHRRLRTESSAIVSMSGEGFAGGPGTEAAGTDGPVMVVRARRFARTSPAVAVVALGTNDAWDPELRRLEPMRSLDDVFDAFRPACTVAVLVAERTTASHYDEARAQALNERLRQRADVVVDWRLHAAPGDLEPDDIHPTARGQASYARAVAAGVHRCLSAGTP